MDVGKKPGTVRLLPLSAWLIICIMILAPGAAFAPAFAKDVLIAWEGLDGVAAGYKVYWGESSRTYDYNADAGPKTEYIVRGLQDEVTYYFSTTAYDSNHNESEFSKEAVLVSSTAPSGFSGPGGSCFIATAAYGSNFAPEVQALRDFRDAHLMTNPPGRLLVNAYYSISPPIADLIRENNFLKALTRWVLSPLVYTIKNPLTALLLMALTAAGSLLSGRIACSERQRRSKSARVDHSGDSRKG